MTTPERYTHGHHESVLRGHRWRTVENSAAYLLEHLAPGISLLDVGCGPGTITVGLAARVAPGEVVAIDTSEAALADARTALELQPDVQVRFETGDIYQLGYPDGSFDVVHAHQVMQHLSDPVAALREMARVCRPGGVVAARDADYGAMTWYPRFEGLERWREIYEALARANRGEPDGGRELYSWATRAGFSEVRASASVWCFATPEEREYWGGQWAARVTESSFATQAAELGLADGADLAEIAATWREWTSTPDGWFAVLHGEIICRP